jgi:hypothetical protein
VRAKDVIMLKLPLYDSYLKRLRWMGLASFGALAACSSPEINASDYSRACSTDDECALVFGGDVCVCDGERTPAAIAASARRTWTADFDSLAADCSGPDIACPPSPTRDVRCHVSVCVVVGR